MCYKLEIRWAPCRVLNTDYVKKKVMMKFFFSFKGTSLILYKTSSLTNLKSMFLCFFDPDTIRHFRFKLMISIITSLLTSKFAHQSIDHFKLSPRVPDQTQTHIKCHKHRRRTTTAPIPVAITFPKNCSHK